MSNIFRIGLSIESLMQKWNALSDKEKEQWWNTLSDKEQEEWWEKMAIFSHS